MNVRKSRMIYVLWMLFFLVFWFVTGSYGGMVVFWCSLIVPAVLVFLTAVGTKKIEGRITTQKTGRKGEIITGTISISNESIIPLIHVKCGIKCENLLTGEVFHPSVKMTAPARTKSTRQIELKSEYCGKIIISSNKLVVWDPFGLARFYGRVSKESSYLLIHPDTFGLEAEIAYGESMSLDSDEFSMLKAGFDPSETFAIREYHPGDKIKQIHWKLSEKLGDLTVRDYGLPIQNTIILMLENGMQSKGETCDASCMDALGEGLVSLSQELAEQGIVHCIGVYDHRENAFFQFEITDTEDLTGNLSWILGALPGTDKTSVIGHYLENHEQFEFAHVVLFAPTESSDLKIIRETSLATEIICGTTGTPGSENHSIYTSPVTLPEDMAYIEL